MGVIGKPEFERCIEDMVIGESGYAFPWALAYDEDNIPYLDLTHPIFSTRDKRTLEDPGERILIKKTGPGKNEYEVNITNTDYRWTPEEDLEEEILEGNPWIVCLDPVKYKLLEEKILESGGGWFEYAGGYIKGEEWRNTPPHEDTKTYLVNEDPKKFPETYELRKDLNAMIENENYEDAAEMRDLINSTDEPLEGYESSEPTIDSLVEPIAKKIVARKRPCPDDPKTYPLTHEYRRNLNQLKAEKCYDEALEVAVLINSTQEPLSLI